jgi:S-adenosylmethionine:tRNA ribosyltransferase-isomerase
MSHDFSIDAYDYELPQELIAQEPLSDRASSKLLVLDRSSGDVRHRVFADLPDLLSPGDLLVTNRSRVFPARLLGRRAGGGEAEILLVREREPDLWEAMVRPGRRLRPGALVEIAPAFHVRIEGDSATPGTESAAKGPMRAVRLVSDELDPREAIERHAPTAGLHFTPHLLGRLEAQGVARAELVLHVGPGTFRPVEVDDVREHRVDAERFTIPARTAAAINRARGEGRRVVAVGTTTTRVLESAVGEDGTVSVGDEETDLVIVPGHRFGVVDALVTNFHLPRSSLLLLVSAFAGRKKALAAYAEAVRLGYRFYSYGDAMLIV